MARLVDLLGGEEVLLLLQRRGVDVGGEVVGDGVLAPEEQAVVPQRRLALELGEVLAPLARVLGEVELRRAPVAALPARVQVLVGDRVGRQARRGVAAMASVPAVLGRAVALAIVVSLLCGRRRPSNRITNVIEIAIALSSRMRIMEPTERGPPTAPASAERMTREQSTAQHARAPARGGAQRVRAQRLPRRLGRGDRLRGRLLDGRAVLELRRQGGPVPGADGARDRGARARDRRGGARARLGRRARARAARGSG